MGLTEAERAEGAEALRVMLSDWAARAPGDRDEAVGLYETWLERVQSQGWTRREVYSLICESVGASATGFPEHAYDWLIEIADELAGFCHPSRAVRFPDAPV